MLSLSSFRLLLIPLLLIRFLCPARAEVVISEIHAAPNGLLLEWNGNSEPRLGVGPYWQDLVFQETGWTAGTAPLGVGTTNPTNLSSLLLNKTPSFYVRKNFTVNAAQFGSGNLILRLTYDDGFVAFINGKEIARANLGPAKQMTYASMVATRVDAPAAPVEYNLGPLTNWLQEGQNVLAVQVHNQLISSNSKFDAQLLSVISSVTGTTVNLNFSDSNNATMTRTYNAGAVSATSDGTPLAGSWVAAPAPIVSSDWQEVTVKTTASTTGGFLATGGLQYNISQSGPDAPLALLGGSLSMAPFIAPAAMTTADLAKLTVSFRYRLSPGASFGLRFDATPGGAALTGFPNLASTGTSVETPALTFSTNSGGQRKRSISDTGVVQDVTSGSLVTSATIFSGTALRGLAAEIIRLTEDNSAAAGDGGSTGVLKLEMISQPTVPDFFGITVGGFIVQGWPSGPLPPAQLADLSAKFSWKADAGASFMAYLEPSTGGYADRLDLGTYTGTGTWQTTQMRCSEGTNTTAFLTKVNASNVRSLRMVFRRTTSLPAGSVLWFDNLGLVNEWKNYATTLGAGTVGAQAAFVAAVRASGVAAFIPVFEKQSTAPALPESLALTVDDMKVVFSGLPATTPATFIATNQAWKYWPGLAEPSGGLVETALFPTLLEPEDFSDWLELHNDGPELVNLAGWSLTDTVGSPQKFTLPPGTQLAPGARMVILADDPALPISGATYLHANFKLSATGGYLALTDPSGAIHSELAGYGQQFPNYTYGLDPADSGNYVYLTTATPGTANNAATVLDYVRTPDFSLPGGFYTGAQTLTLTCETAGAQIRYTTDGSDPSATSQLYTAPLILSQVSAGNGHCLRARAFKAGLAPSGSKTHTFLIDQSPNLRTGPAIILTGDPQRSLFDPFGVMAINGGTYAASSGPWSSDGPLAYNNANADGSVSTSTGRGWERPVEVEYYFPNGQDGFRQRAGVRVSGSPHARLRYTLNNVTNAPWSFTSYLEKPSLNLFFRDDYDQKGLDYPILGDTYKRQKFESLRLRAGKNDPRDPFVRDEYCRRLFTLMGQKTSMGIIVPLYVNGQFRGYYNAVERLREEFMQAHYDSAADWDVRYIADVVDGDAVAFTDLVARLNAYGADLTNPAKLQAVLDVIDLTNFADYALLNAWTGTGDWPHNNYTWSRERSATGKWRLHVWDAEGAFGGFSKGLGYNVFTQDLLTNPTGTNREICHVYFRIKNSPEFRLLMADRINRHFCNDGVMTDASLTSVKGALVNSLQPLFTYTGGGALNQSFFNTWVNPTNDKRDVFFRSALLSNSGTAASIGSYASGGGSSTIVNLGAHTLVAGLNVTIAGSTVTAYNGTFTIAAVTTNTITIPVPFTTDPGAGSRGTWLQATADFGYQVCKENIWPARLSTLPVPVQQGTWMAPLPPLFGQHGGNVPRGYQLAVLHTEVEDDRTKSNPYKAASAQTPANRIIYYTKDGSDPRLTGGALNPTALIYSSPFTLTNAFTTIKSRIKNTSNNEWSPLTEALFTVDADPPSNGNIVVAEVMYHPPPPTAVEIAAGFLDRDDFEFIRLQNISDGPVDLRTLQFIDGVEFNFAITAVPAFDAGTSVFLVNNRAAFRHRYGVGYDAKIVGEYAKNFNNDGEAVMLRRNSLPAVTVQQFTYDDNAPWPSAADGTGASLILINPASNPDHTVAANWTASALPGGLFQENERPNYNRWRDFSFTPAEAANPLIAGPQADADQDGYSNLTEFALAMPPKSHQTNGPAVMLQTINGLNYLCIEFRTPNNAPKISVQPQVASSLNAWSAPGSDVVPVSATPHADGSTTYVYRDTHATQNAARRFIRLWITLLP